MMRQYELVERVLAYNPRCDEALLNRAYVYSMQKHGHQTRASGDPYFSHPLEVAAILTEMRMDDATIAVALLHDTIEDTDATRQEIDQLFGPTIGALVDGLTKIDRRLTKANGADRQGENLRKLLLAVADDVRVLLVKLADRLHNMRTLHYVPVEKRRRVAEETMDVHAPLAGRMGIFWMREELEDLAFAELFPTERAALVDRLAARHKDSGSLVAEIEQEILHLLADAGIKANVAGRKKRAYSIFSKMKRKSINFENLSDLYGIRITVDSVEDCYKALGVLHTAWKVVPGRFKDYISTPKQNDYQSIHTTLVGPRQQRVEMQIRTAQMHNVAEYGIASHALYKDGADTKSEGLRASRAYAWLRQTVEQLSEEGGSSAEFLENTKLELFQEQVFCFTPRGKLITLPPGATPIDFAYHVHTQIGDSCVSAKVNGQERPLNTALSSGDEVEIITKPGATPPAAWRELATTGKARAAIRKANRLTERKKLVRLGEELIGNALAPYGHSGRPQLDGVADAFKLPDGEAVALAVGEGRVDAVDVLAAMGHTPGENGALEPRNVSIRGVRSDVAISFSQDHLTVPGDDIVGVLDPGAGVTVYPRKAAEAMRTLADEPQRWVQLSWHPDASRGPHYPVDIGLTVQDERGTLASVAASVADHGANIDGVKVNPKGPELREMTLRIEVRDKSHLDAVIQRLRKLRNVVDARRL